MQENLQNFSLFYLYLKKKKIISKTEKESITKTRNGN